MIALITFFATTPTPAPVPDSGVTALLVSGGILSLGLFARFVKNRKK